MRFVVATVNYRCADVIVRNLKTTADQIASAGGTWYIVDNCSGDDSVPKLQSALQGIEQAELIRAERNGGFGYGNNRLVERVIDGRVEADYVYFLNPDAIPEPGSIALMTSYLDDHPAVGVVGSALVNDDGTPTQSMFRFPSFLSEIEAALAIGPVSRLLARYRVPLPPLSSSGPVDWVSGASMMVRTEALRAVGGFDENFFLYWEEVELCHRIRKAGFGIHALPDAKVRHIGGVSTGVNGQSQVPSYWHQSRNLFFRKTELGGPLSLLNLATAVALAVGRVWDVLRGKSGKPPRFLRDHLKFSLAKQRHGHKSH